MPYKSDLTEEQYDIIKGLIVYNKVTRPRANSLHSILNGIMYQLKNGCIWCDLPKDLPPYSTCFYYYKRWSIDGTWDTVLESLHILERRRVGKKRPS
jgi:transposase